MNALNVYPVPDGDTGTNMLHTMRSALAHARAAAPDPAAVLAAAGHGALMGARGNSGVLLSQVLRGVQDAQGPAGLDLVRAFALAHEYARSAVTQPAPGTMLSALGELKDGLADDAGDAAAMLRRAVEDGRAAVERTREDNPVNRAAGVVDAGARGIWLLLDGALAAVEGRPIDRDRSAVPRAPVPAGAVLVATPDLPPSWIGAYDVQCLITRPSRSIAELRAEMLAFGADCVIVVGDATLAKVHVHTTQPDQILRIALAAGRIGDVVVEDLEAMSAEHAAETGIVVPPAPAAAVAVVAVVPGEGLGRIAASLGATVIRGGATMNPSTEQLLDAVRRANAAHVVVLPNDKNVVLAAEQAARLAEAPVTVLPARNVAQGMAALAAWDHGDPPEAAIAAMREAAAGAHAIELTTAIRAAEVDGQQVGKGEHLALLDGKLVAHDDDELSALASAAQAVADAELFTLYVGAGVDADRRDAAAARLRATFPAAEVEVVDGGQPHYPFIVAAE